MCELRSNFLWLLHRPPKEEEDRSVHLLAVPAPGPPPPIELLLHRLGPVRTGGFKFERVRLRGLLPPGQPLWGEGLTGSGSGGRRAPPRWSKMFWHKTYFNFCCLARNFQISKQKSLVKWLILGHDNERSHKLFHLFRAWKFCWLFIARLENKPTVLYLSPVLHPRVPKRTFQIAPPKKIISKKLCLMQESKHEKFLR